MNEEQKHLQQSEMFQELILSLAPAAAETVQAIADIPAQLELLSRATLACSFIHKVQTPGGRLVGHDFDVERFEKAWSYLAGTYEPTDKDPENDPQTP